ncbi:AMP-binding protein [Synoicihabitans lomoniglobus]|uniref:AMP-binding protein n=1 Tax=Synoicihabitans lomoniglobus TaxID=2909285 RepID=A0AAF0I3S3_9BACT|nr:AMP-binding protein [Opitutaceae bacterium LMO-M01]WED66329.1 AMP-binding protein [Opitutaceae bacterium LMO-M01]
MERRELARLLGYEPTEQRGAVVVAERDRVAFRAAFGAAVAGRGPVFLANPDWGQAEWSEFDVLRQSMPSDFDAEQGWLMIPTGGSSGGVKLARHDQNTLGTAVDGFAEWVGDGAVTSTLGVLPLHHVGGLMAWLRSVLMAGDYRDVAWAEIKAGVYLEVDEGAVISLVPTQLAQLLESTAGVDWLRGFSMVFVGGGPAWKALQETSRARGIRLAPCYGMTETAAMVTALRPEAFLAGTGGVGPALPHAQIEIIEENRLVIHSASLFRGYWPNGRVDASWVSGDWGACDCDGNWTIGGRHDALILTGGEKVDPAEVETVLRAFMGRHNVAVIGVPDARWGEVVVACHDGEPLDHDEMDASVSARLARYKRPKAYVAVNPWPTNAMGKLDRSELRKWAGG